MDTEIKKKKVKKEASQVKTTKKKKTTKPVNLSSRDKKKQDEKRGEKRLEAKLFNDLEGKFLLVRVGNNEQPASSSQIKDVEEKIVELFEKNDVNCLVFVTHHCVDAKIIEKKLI